jgi:hypothetical protein
VPRGTGPPGPTTMMTIMGIIVMMMMMMIVMAMIMMMPMMMMIIMGDDCDDDDDEQERTQAHAHTHLSHDLHRLRQASFLCVGDRCHRRRCRDGDLRTQFKYTHLSALCSTQTYMHACMHTYTHTYVNMYHPHLGVDVQRKCLNSFQRRHCGELLWRRGRGDCLRGREGEGFGGEGILPGCEGVYLQRKK